MAPQTQKALVVTEIGKPLTLITTRPVTQPGPSQVQLRVTVAGPNPHDHMARDQGFFIADNLPAVLTNDVAGEVTALGPGVTRYAIGDHIVGQAGIGDNYEQNGLQEFAILDVDFSAKIPEGFTDDDGATLPTNTIAPLTALFDQSCLGIPPPWSSAASSFDYQGTTLLVLGGGSSCGKFGVQLAKLAGIGRIVVVGGDESELKSYGATHVIDRHQTPDELNAAIRNIVGDELLYAYDAINPLETQFIGVNALSSTKRGKLARLIPVGSIDESRLHPKKAGWDLADVQGLSHWKPEVSKPFWERVPQYPIEKKLIPSKHEVVQGLDADKVNEVLDRYRDGAKVIKTHFHI